LLDGELRGILNEPFGDLDDVAGRNRQPDCNGQASSQQLIRKHPHMLRVIAELDHVQIPVRGQHEVALSAAAHASNLLNRHHRHGSSILEPAKETGRKRCGVAHKCERRGASGSIATEEAHGTGSHHPERFAPQ